MKKLHLTFKNDLRKTICAFSSYKEQLRFVQIAHDLDRFEQLPEVDPFHHEVPYFETAKEALEYYKLVN
jgi:hypothetical protein